MLIKQMYGVLAPEERRVVATGETRGLIVVRSLAPVGATESVAPTGARRPSHSYHGFHPWLHSAAPPERKRANQLSHHAPSRGKVNGDSTNFEDAYPLPGPPSSPPPSTESGRKVR